MSSCFRSNPIICIVSMKICMEKKFVINILNQLHVLKEGICTNVSKFFLLKVYLRRVYL